MISLTISTLVAVDALGAEQDWAFTPASNVSWNENISPDGGISFDGSPEGDTAALTGCAVAVLDAAIPDEAACEVKLSNPSDAGTLFVTIKGGDPVEYVFINGGSDITHSVVSGTGSGLSVVAGDDSPQSQINDTHIAVAS